MIPPPTVDGALLRRARLTAHRSQQAFDVLLRALAEPGTIHTVPDGVIADGVPAHGLLALAITDVGVAVSVDDDLDDPFAQLVRDATGADLTSIEQAWCVTLGHPDPAMVERCAVGTALAPEDGARLAVAVTDLHPHQRPNEGAVELELSGPGVDGRHRVGVSGVDAGFFVALADANRNFPAGIDCWLLTPNGTVAALARSTTVEIMKEN